MKNINIKVKEIFEKYQTNNPFELCELIGIICVIEELHIELNAILQHVKNHKFIYINKNLSTAEQLSTCGHELGHAILHGKYNCTFLKNSSPNNKSPHEKDANLFASMLLNYKDKTKI